MNNYTKAFGLLTVKSIDEEQRIIKGIASTPSPDRVDDVVDPNGAKFTLPIPLLWQHNHDMPIGEVKSAKVSENGIEIEAQLATVEEEGALKDRLDEAWQSIKSGLVKGLSIGFRGLEYEQIKGTFGLNFKFWDWYELSVVTIPANMEASITSIKKLSSDLSNPPDAIEQEDKPLENPVGDSTKKHLIVKLENPNKGGVKL